MSDLKRFMLIFLILASLYYQSFSNPFDFSENKRLEVQVNDQAGTGLAGAIVHLQHRLDPALYDRIVQSDSTGLALFEDIYTSLASYGEPLPVQYNLSQSYPNPFTSNTSIPFSMLSSGKVDLYIYNVKGERVRHLASQQLQAGGYQVFWSGRDDLGASVATGIYFAKLVTNVGTKTIKMMNLGTSGSTDGIVLRRYTNPGNISKTMSTQPYVLTIVLNGYITINDSTLIIDENSERLSYVMQKIVDQAPIISLEDRISIEDVIPDPIYLPDYISDELPYDSLEMEIEQTNPELIHYHIVADTLFVDSLEQDGFGFSDVTLTVSDPGDNVSQATFRHTVEPQADIVGTLRDVITKEAVVNITTYFNDAAVKSDSNGGIHVQLSPGEYVFSTDTTGRRLETHWNLSYVGTDDINLDSLLKKTTLKSIPVSYIPIYVNGDLNELMVDVKSAYGDGDHETYAQNRIWDPNIKHPGMRKGVKKTSIVGYNLIDGDQEQTDNLNWAFEKLYEGTDNAVGPQMPLESDRSYVFAPTGIAEEIAMLKSIRNGEAIPEAETKILLTKWLGSANASNAELVPDSSYADEGISVITIGSLRGVRAEALSELTTLFQCTEDVSNTREELLAAGTMYGKTLDMDHQIGYLKTVEYGPDNLLISPERYIGAMSYTTPLNTRFERDRIVIPKRE
ncbi:MAG: T9SS type A sorting domain-containing protein [candidate division KSB1 bacterium]|jgi:hypothetical protein|nr:T9SS type A sorting domain-containing protein [candidate division KSB1 bacterium]